MKTVGPARSAGILQQNRVFLDFFWDLAKPDQEVRLKAIEALIQYLKANNKVSQHCHGKVLEHLLMCSQRSKYSVIFNYLNNSILSVQISFCRSTFILSMMYITSVMLPVKPCLNYK